MRRPDRYIDKDKPSHVCKPKKIIHGLTLPVRGGVEMNPPRYFKNNSALE